MSLEISKKNKANKIDENLEKKLMYGIFGIVMAVVGLLIWTWAFMAKIEEHLLMFLSFGRMFGLDFLRNLPDSLVGAAVTKAAILGFASVVSILSTLWIVGYWRGENKRSVRDFVSEIGNVHYYIGLGYLVATMTVLIDWKFSIVVVLINMLLGMILSFVLAANIFKVQAKRVFSFVSLAFGAYIILFIIFIMITF